MAIATGTAIALAVAAGTATSSVVAAHKGANAVKESAKLQTESADKAAEIQGRAAAEELAFKRKQAQIDWQNSQQTAKANYDQWAAGRGRLRSLASMTGIDLGADPAFVPGINPGFDSPGGPSLPPSVPGGGPTPGTGVVGPQTGGAIDWTAPDPQLAAQLSAFFKSKGVPDTEVPYWVSKRPELVARGQEINNPNYANDRLFAADILGGGRAAPAATKAPPLSMATLAYAPTGAAPILAPGVTGMPAPYAPRRPYSFADMVR
jgi:hypothetical protein